MRNVWAFIVRGSSGEWMLNRFSPNENGGGVVLARAFWIAILAYIVLLGGHEIIDPSRRLVFSFSRARELVIGSGGLFGAVFAAAYASLYSRFASQWSYLAGVYNQIKAAEIAALGKQGADALVASWKVGFIDDALVLHLARKPLFASVIANWGDDANVETELKHYPEKARQRIAKRYRRRRYARQSTMARRPQKMQPSSRMPNSPRQATVARGAPRRALRRLSGQSR